jgi:uncharacterized protein
MMTAISRPLPDLDEPDTGPFWKAAQQHRLIYQHCDNCGSVVFYPRAQCTTCGSGRLEERDSAGRGRVYSYTIIRANPHPAFRDTVPYAIAYVDLDEGFRMVTHIVGTDLETIRVHQPVVLSWTTVDGMELPTFTPAVGEAAS